MKKKWQGIVTFCDGVVRYGLALIRLSKARSDLVLQRNGEAQYCLARKRKSDALLLNAKERYSQAK